MDFFFKVGELEFFFNNDADYIDVYSDTIIEIRIIDKFHYSCEVEYFSRFKDLLAFWCGGKRSTYRTDYEFRSQKARNHFTYLIEGFNTGRKLEDRELDPPTWKLVPDLDSIRF